MLSSTYRMSSRTSRPPDGGRAAEIDPENTLLHRMRIRRLEGEAIRDAILSISGRLDTRMFGPPVPIHLTPFMDGRGRPSKSGPVDGDGRRSIYIEVRRNFLSPMMLTFDMPIPFTAMGKRTSSNVPAQALTLMNDPAVVGQAQVWSRRILEERSESPEKRIRSMYVRALARPPTATEETAALPFLERQSNSYGLEARDRMRDGRVWRDLGHVLFNTKDFIFIE